MKSMNVICIAAVFLVGMVAASGPPSRVAQEPLLEQAESRLRAIYDRREFRAREFRADWLPDSSGYTTSELAPDSNERVVVSYDAVSGTRTAFDSDCRYE